MAAATLTKGLRLLATIVADEGRSNLTRHAEALGMPLATAHRLVLTLEAEGFLQRSRKGYYHPGPAYGGGSFAADPSTVAGWRLRAPLARLAARHEAHAHFGVLDDMMVTYLVKEGTHETRLFTAERGQLEAYCSAIGKVLLAALPASELTDYLAGGPFVALTPHTLTAPADLAEEIRQVQKLGVAFDRFEIREDLFCISVPVHAAGDRVIGAISLSLVNRVPEKAEITRIIRDMRKVANAQADRRSTAS